MASGTITEGDVLYEEILSPIRKVISMNELGEDEFPDYSSLEIFDREPESAKSEEVVTEETLSPSETLSQTETLSPSETSSNSLYATKFIQKIVKSIINGDFISLQNRIISLPWMDMDWYLYSSTVSLLMNSCDEWNRDKELKYVLNELRSKNFQENSLNGLSVCTSLFFMPRLNYSVLRRLLQYRTNERVVTNDINYIGAYEDHIESILNLDKGDLPLAFALDRMDVLYGRQNVDVYKRLYDLVVGKVALNYYTSVDVVEYIVSKLILTSPFADKPSWIKNIPTQATKPFGDRNFSSGRWNLPGLNFPTERLPLSSELPLPIPSSFDTFIDTKFLLSDVPNVEYDRDVLVERHLGNGKIETLQVRGQDAEIRTLIVADGKDILEIPTEINIIQKIPLFSNTKEIVQLLSDERIIQLLTYGLDPIQKSISIPRLQNRLDEDKSLEYRQEILLPVLRLERSKIMRKDSYLNALLGQANPGQVYDDSFCWKYGGHRMLTCNCFELNEYEDVRYSPGEDIEPDDWFVGFCRYQACFLKISKRCYAVRIPIPGGGWYGCYCCWEHAYDAQYWEDPITTFVIEEFKALTDMDGIFDRIENPERVGGR